MSNEYPETCSAGHSMTEANDAHKALVAHVAGLSGPDLIAEVRCMTVNLMPRAEQQMDPTDYLGMTVFVSMIQRLDASKGPTDDQIAPVAEAIEPGTCSCHADVTIYDRLNNYIEARNHHVDLHKAEAAAEDTPVGGYL